jgi:nucleotide-binding universal stress UspA family protein
VWAGCPGGNVFKTILVAVDGSELSDHVMKALRELTIGAQTQVILSHVIAPAESEMEQPADLRHDDSALGTYRHFEQQLQAYQATLPCQTQLEIVTGDPAEEIVRLAHIHHADLIIIGSRGLTGVNRILKGSVSSQVVSDAHCSVFVVRPD